MKKWLASQTKSTNVYFHEYLSTLVLIYKLRIVPT